MEAVVPGKLYCSDLSLQAGEPLSATATVTRQFLLFENNDAWEDKAFERSSLPEEVKAHVWTYARAHSDCKILLIRSARSLAEPGTRFIAARLSDKAVDVFSFHFDRYEELLQVDLPALMTGETKYAKYRRTAPLYLVCTHGRRDRCCARAGIPVYNEVLEAARTEDRNLGVWQCSHIGGHRFAANLISLSSGMLYGRVQPGDVTSILAAEHRGIIQLDNLRGRMCYPPQVQAAEIALRRRTGEGGLWAYHLEELEDVGPNNWKAKFNNNEDKVFEVFVSAVKTATQVFESCTMDKSTVVVEYTCEVSG